MTTGGKRLSSSSSEDDPGWMIGGIEYLFQVDARTSDQRVRLEALRKRVKARIARARADK